MKDVLSATPICPPPPMPSSRRFAPSLARRMCCALSRYRSCRKSAPNFLQESREAPGHFIFYEIFASQADFEAHNQTPHVRSWFARRFCRKF
ncbi:putative quinol monooxygenase [Phyllobacterium bourgognense]|uniref:putative quinol monooxygenase n=1 Tax=Phyllobacterium bourgognense TaxID=314236 RepID=UPI003CCB3F6C